MNQTTWMTAQSVWRKGFCTEIEGTKGVQWLKMISSDDYADTFYDGKWVTNEF
jgi:hypothetical protein